MNLVGASDVDMDGDLDLVILDKSTGTSQIIKNQGSENFVPQLPSSLNLAVDDVIIADMDQDGSTDLVYSSQNMVGWAKNNGSEGFLPKAPLITGTSDISAIESEDFDNDGDNDIFCSKSFDCRYWNY